MSNEVDRAFSDLLALEREYDDMPAGAEARMLRAIETTIAAGGPGGDGGGDGDGGDGGGSPGGGGSAAGSASSAGAALKAAPWLARAAYVAVGVVAGASGHAMLESAPAPAPAPSAIVAPAVAHVVPSASATPGAELDVPTLAVSSLPSSRAPSAPKVPASPSAGASARHDDAKVAEERADLDVARAALSRGRAQAALEAIDRHSRTYGEGHFAEEREVLAVQALLAAGRRDEAEARARRFHAKYPTSLFGPAMTQSLGRN